MPIRPENKNRYPKNWSEIRAAIQKRSGDRCEICGVKNYAEGVRDENGDFHEIGSAGAAYLYDTAKEFKPITIVCTVMHLDHQPENNDPSNLKFGCQRCHNKYDAPFRAANRKKNRENL